MDAMILIATYGAAGMNETAFVFSVANGTAWMNEAAIVIIESTTGTAWMNVTAFAFGATYGMAWMNETSAGIIFIATYGTA